VDEQPLPPYDAPEAPPDVRQFLDSHPTCLGDGEPLFRDATLDHGAWHLQPAPANEEFYEQAVGGGVAMADFDGDGDFDLYVGVSHAGNALLLNDGYGRFHQADWAASIAFPDDRTNGVSAADYDNDGDQDLYLSNKGPDRLLRNRGDGRFDDVTESAGIDSPSNSATASWADLDGDGFLDIVVAVHGNDLDNGYVSLATPDGYLSDADGGFRAMNESIFYEGSTYIMPLLDLDADGDPDVLYTQEFGTEQLPMILENLDLDENGQMQWRSRTQAPFEVMSPAPMGAAVLDIDDNVFPDVYTTNLWGEEPSGEILGVNSGEFAFVEQAGSQGAVAMTGAYDVEATTRATSWAAVAADVQNDGFQDLFVAYGRIGETLAWRDGANYPPLEPVQPDALLLGGPDGGFQLADGSCAESPGETRGAAVGDLDGDGCLDLYIVPRRGSGQLLMNRCNSGHNFVELELVGTRDNRDAVGSMVELSIGDRTQRRWVTASSTSVLSSSPKRVHFGLGSASGIDRIRVSWPDGTIQQLDEPQINSIHVVEQPSQ
jgi:hypothetical protein